MNTAPHFRFVHLRSCWVALLLASPVPLVFADTATVPRAPSNVSVTTGNGQALIAFTPPTAPTGISISGYTASCTLTGSSVPSTATATQSPVTITGLSAGNYSCSVVANFVGSTASSVSKAEIKTAPTVLGVSTGNASVSIAFASFTGAKTHTASCQPNTTGKTITGTPVTTSPAQVKLKNGVTYTCSLVATSADGVISSATTVSSVVTPQ